MPINRQGIVADEATIKGMVMAFGQAQAEAKDSQANVTAASNNLSAQWQSDAAAPRFQQAVQQWLNGFMKVQQGLNMLNDNMQQYAQLTTTTEDDSAMLSGGWARG
ncbi:WXG100 family type VII secretion target [Micromonospora sp. NPDC023633]|uniref:WXG100 family type VII secretion target n=1 Tax=Micromonospora sp. NPDC023633 TaxID=3154320 RepID=UPI0033D09E79